MSLLTYGLREQFGLMDLQVTGRPERFGETLAFAADMVVYVVQRGADIPEGDTVSRDEDQRPKVRYEPSPVEPQVKVWRVDLPQGAAARADRGGADRLRRPAPPCGSAPAAGRTPS